MGSKPTETKELLMAGTAFQGHAETSASKAAYETPDEVAPADRRDYDPAAEEWADVPGSGARAAGQPRHDGSSGSINQGGRVANGSARRG